MIQMKWRADSENSENSALPGLDTIIVSHKIYEKKIILIRFALPGLLRRLNNLLVPVYI
jgi:hypothetical protein